ncbi:glycerol-3-phosphate dehydrogenase [Acaryochloris sp. CCMEE 5410]|uniref:glycerol-3-phosphate dehydrogenase n=1 Tax=Acaryochloris sp. CCMEE 5410 TaxID=310037 RepID=UPI0002484A85|nr:glycerol-3-phosphate dehydrogenase [Acaryochloris sp. CCMEE 5410]KAI9133171.1 glycerol-3-phosphate dehydrogenase [Acaryochloris sp. CCMEE 5410]
MRNWQTIENTAFDLVVIGGGSNGAGVARDAALRGLKTLLIDKDDFGSGTTGWSSRLIHGGLRYLEYFEFNLVRESLREREVLLRVAPHLVRPLQMSIPVYASGSRAFWEIQAGMLLYDVLSFDKSLPNHRILPLQKCLQLFRHLNPKGLKGAAQYFDAQVVHAERLCLELVLSAQTAGATTLNYAQVSQLQIEGDRVTGITLDDLIAETTHRVQLSPQTVVINTAGPWVDQVLQGIQSPTLKQERKIGGTKGSHIIVDPFPGAPDTALYVEAEVDNRPFFILPWANQYLIGTTDIRYSGDLDRVKADNEEIDYLLNETNRVIPCAQLSRADIRFTYAGVRPLPYSEGKKTSSITRSHILYDHGKDGITNLISLIGGKLTTYRQVGEEMVDAVLKKQGCAPIPCVTKQELFPGAIALNDTLIETMISKYQSLVSRETVFHLFSIYGSFAVKILALIDDTPELAEPITPSLPDIKAQVVYAVQSEQAYTLVDICVRRTILAMQTNYGFDVLPEVTAILKQYCNWSDADCDRHIQHYHRFMEANSLPDFVTAQTTAPIR